MQWTDEAVVLSVRPHGETAAIIELFTRDHGRHLGVAQGGRSRKLRPVLQTGNHVDVAWRGRLADQLGQVTFELRGAHAAQAMDDAAALAGLASISAFLRLLPERDPHPSFFEVTLFVLGFFEEAGVWPALFVRWELKLLEELGFGLDLSSCAATGTADDLVYVSPRSGRAVSAEAGRPYAGKLLALPAFLRTARGETVTERDVTDGLALTGYFLAERVFAPRGIAMPDVRMRLPSLLSDRRAPSR